MLTCAGGRVQLSEAEMFECLQEKEREIKELAAY